LPVAVLQQQVAVWDKCTCAVAALLVTSLFLSILLYVASAVLFASLCISHARQRGGAAVRCEEEQWQWQWSPSP